MQLWGIGGTPPRPSGEYSPFYTTTKSSRVQNAQWLPWEAFSPPMNFPSRGEENNTPVQITSATLPDGRVQLFVVDNVGEIFTSLQDSVIFDSPFAPWALFISENFDGGLGQNLTAARLPNGSVNLWGVGTFHDSPQTIFSLTRPASGNPSTAALGGWDPPWAPFLVGGRLFLSVLAVLGAASDLNNVTYLWAYSPAPSIAGVPPGWFMTSTSNGTAWAEWSPFEIPVTPPSPRDPKFDQLAAARRSDGGLILFARASDTEMLVNYQLPNGSWNSNNWLPFDLP